MNEEEQLLPKFDYGSSFKLHMQTYTAGEDNNRLAEMAKEFGLKQHRQPRRQVREVVSTPLSSLTEFFHERFLHHEFANVRLRSVFTSHNDYDDDEEGRELIGLPPKWQEDTPEEDIQDPHLPPTGGDLTSAVLGIIKGMVGPAILYLPHGFAKAGWIFAIPCLILSTCLFLASSACLLDAWRLESAKSNSAELLLPEKSKRTILSYPELAHRALGSTGEAFVKIGIALMQSGVCLTYLIFVPQNLAKVTSILFDYDIDASYFIIVMLLVEIPMSWIRDIRKLTVTNLLANVLILYGLIVCLAFALSNAVESEAARGPISEIAYKFSNLDVFNSEGWFLFIGTSVLLFEGTITLLVPIQESIYCEVDRKNFPMLYQKVILSIICFYCIFGMCCWVSFGDDVKIVMTTSLPSGFLASTVQLAYSTAVIFTFPLQNFPSLEIATHSLGAILDNNCGKRTAHLQTRNIIATSLVFLLALVGIAAMDNLDKVVSLMGGLLGCPLAFIFPPLIHNNIDENITDGRKKQNLIIAGLGCVAMIIASWQTISTW